MRRVIPLSEVDRHSFTLVGGKGAQLAAMLAGGLPVPDGLCVTTDAYRAGMDAALRAEVAERYQAMGGPPVAVRSSATAEDLPEASFAGQQDTFLNVSGVPAVCDAITRCWQSLYSERAVAYRRDRRIPEDRVAMAVVVQRMVEAEAAGVLFTVNPVTGAPDELVVEAALGLGDQVVSARVTPDRYRLRRRAPHEIIERQGAATAGLLTPPLLSELAEIALAAERVLGRAADIEWAASRGRMFLLQARAVTAISSQGPDVEFGSAWSARACSGRLIFWSNHNVRETMPYPHTPFSWSVWKTLLMPHLLTAMGMTFPGELMHPEDAPMGLDLVEGRVHWNMNVCDGLFGARVWEGITRLVDEEAATACAAARRSGELQPVRPSRRLRRYLRTLTCWVRSLVAAARPQVAWNALRLCREEADNIGRVDLSVLNEEQILAFTRHFAHENTSRGVRANVLAFACCLGAAPALFLLQKGLPRWGIREPLAPLLAGIAGNPTLETALALWDLAASADEEAKQVLLRHDAASVAAELEKCESGRAFLDRLRQFLAEHGHRSAREFDLACPRWRDDPTFLYDSLRNYLGHPAGEMTPRQHYERQVREHEEAKVRIQGALARHPLRRWLFRRAMRILEERIHLREAPKFYGLAGLAQLRDMYVEVFRRLLRRGVLENPDEGFFLTLEELEQVAAGQRDRAWIAQVVPERRRRFARQKRASLPLVLRSDGRTVRVGTEQGTILRGTAASAGVVRGRVRILMDPSDGAALEKGEILVAPFTDPGWTPLFLTAAGLVMEVGGIISHGAVVAREYGIPAVVGVRDATRLLRQGEWIELNGTSGEVVRLAPGATAVAA